MSLSVPSIPASLLAPSTPFSDLLDLSDNPETPETTYSFQELRQHRTTMQTDEHYLAEPVPDRAPNFNTDDEMVDSETERKDTDFDIDIDSYSSPEGIEVDDVNNAMEDDYTDTTQPQGVSFDNDDLMIDEEEIPYSAPQPALHSSHGSSDLPEASQDTARLPNPQASADVPLFSFSHQDSSMPPDTQFTAQEPPSVPDHSLYEEVPTDNVEVPEQVTSAEAQPSKSDAEAPADLNKDEETPRAQSPAKATEETHTGLDHLSGDVQGHDSTELDNDFHRHGNWSENTSATLAHEPNLLEDQREFEDEQEAVAGNHTEEAGAEISTSAEDPAAIAGFAQYSPHPIVVQFGENRLSLFPPPPPVAEDGSIGSPINDLEFLIQDHDFCEKGVDQLFQELRNVLEGVVGKDVELVMEIGGYGVSISEDNKSCSTFSLQDILNLHVQLHQQDGVETPEPLQINLGTRPTIASRIASLAEAVNQGIGFSHAVGIIESTVEDIEDSYMKAADEHNEDVAEENAQPEHEVNQEVEYNSEDDRLLEEEEENPAPEQKVSQEVYSNLVAPVVEKDTEESVTKVNEPKADPSTEMKKVEEEIDDDDDFDLEYGNEEKEEAENDETEKDHDEVVEMDSKTNDTKSSPGSPSASEPPKSAGTPDDKDSQDTSVSVQFEKKTEVTIEEIPNGPSQDAQQPEEIQDTPSEKIPSEKDDEELIEYEEDNETAEKATVDLEHQEPAESKELSHHSSSGQGSPQTSSHDSPPDQTASHGSPHYSSAEHKSPIQPGSPHVHENQEQKAESPVHPASNGSDQQTAQSKDLSEVKEDNIEEKQDVSTTAKVPSSIPVFQGDEGAEGQYEYVDQHQNEYDGYEYNDQDLFELEEGEYDGEVGDENAEYQEGFEYAANYPTDEQNTYLAEEGNEIPGKIETHETYVGDGAYDNYEDGPEYSAQDANGYAIEYSEESYDGDLAAYEQAEFGSASNIETAPDTDFGVPVKESPQSPSYAINLLEKNSTIIKEVEEEQLIDYEDETELVQEKLEEKSPQLTKSPGDQKRMREDDSVSTGYGSDDENQAAKRVRAL